MRSSWWESVSRKAKDFDVFPKTMEDFRVQTVSGGAMSILSFGLIAVLVVSELVRFLKGEERMVLAVDKSREEMLQIFLDIDMKHINCELLGVDAHDSTGTYQLEVTNGLIKRPIFPDGTLKEEGKETKVFQLRKLHVGDLPKNYCGSCYGASDGCCNNCTAVREAYEKRGWIFSDTENVDQCIREGIQTHVSNEYRVGEGCNLKGVLTVSKVAGNFHISPGHTISFRGQNLHDMSAFREHQLDLSHRIRSLRFGESFPGATNPLVDTTVDEKRLGVHEYFVKIVPTRYRSSWTSSMVETNQYSVQSYFRESDPVHGGRQLPGIFFLYEMSPILVEVETRRRSFFHFIVQLCAIVGGVFVVSGMVDSGVYHGVKLARKMQMGKSD